MSEADFHSLVRKWPALTNGEAVMIHNDEKADRPMAAATERSKREEKRLDLNCTDKGFGSFIQIKEERTRMRQVEVRPAEGGGITLVEFSGSGGRPWAVIHLDPVETAHIARLMLNAIKV